MLHFKNFVMFLMSDIKATGKPSETFKNTMLLNSEENVIIRSNCNVPGAYGILFSMFLHMYKNSCSSILTVKSVPF